MRHETIKKADIVVHPSLSAPSVQPLREAWDGEEPIDGLATEEEKGPPVAFQHFFFCGRS